MFLHVKRLQCTVSVSVSETSPERANLMLERFGGPQGKLAAAQASTVTMPDARSRDTH